MEGLWTRCFPAMKKTSELIENGVIGDVVCVQGDFGWRAKECPYPEDRFWDTKSGGTVYDIGMYLVHLGQLGKCAVQCISYLYLYSHTHTHTI